MTHSSQSSRDADQPTEADLGAIDNPSTSPRPAKLTFRPPAPGRVLAAVVGFAFWCLGIWLVIMASINHGNLTSAIVVAGVMAVAGTVCCWWGLRRRKVGVVIRAAEIEYFATGTSRRIDCHDGRAVGCVVNRLKPHYPNGPAELWIGFAANTPAPEDGGVMATPEDWGVAYGGVVAVPLTSGSYTEAMRKAQAITEHFAAGAACRPVQVLDQGKVSPA